MALQGTIKDFGLADILQLVSLQRKTGTLTLAADTDSVSIRFLQGNVVCVDAADRGVEDLLGSVLVRTGKITEEQLQRALKVQRETLQRLGHVLVKSEAISEADLKEALRVQSLQIIYRLFRWRSGDYRFDTSDDVDYDERLFVPISAETILMEGARMVDEWPIIERRIKSRKMRVRRSSAADELDLDAVSSIVDTDIDFHFDGSEGGSSDSGEEVPEIQISPEEREILALIHGDLTVEQVEERSSLGEFDTYRILCDLLSRNLIEKVDRIREREEEKADPNRAARIYGPALKIVVLLLAVLGLSGLSKNPLTPWRAASKVAATEQLRFYASHTRLERIEEAVQVFYLDAGTFPQELTVLAKNGYLRAEDLLDPWGRLYEFQISPGGYRIFGMDADERPSSELTVAHRFTATQQMMLGNDPEPPPAAEIEAEP